LSAQGKRGKTLEKIPPKVSTVKGGGNGSVPMKGLAVRGGTGFFLGGGAQSKQGKGS